MDVKVLCIFLGVPLVGQQYVILAFPGHSHFLNKLIIILFQIPFDAKGFS